MVLYAGKSLSKVMCGKGYLCLLLCAIVSLTHAVVLSPLISLGDLIYMKGGDYSSTFSSSNETAVIDITKITGRFVDMCDELKAALEGGGGGEEDTCADKTKDVCNDDGNCMWKRKKGKCVPMPWN